MFCVYNLVSLGNCKNYLKVAHYLSSIHAQSHLGPYEVAMLHLKDGWIQVNWMEELIRWSEPVATRKLMLAYPSSSTEIDMEFKTKKMNSKKKILWTENQKFWTCEAVYKHRVVAPNSCGQELLPRVDFLRFVHFTLFKNHPT